MSEKLVYSSDDSEQSYGSDYSYTQEDFSDVERVSQNRVNDVERVSRNRVSDVSKESRNRIQATKKNSISNKSQTTSRRNSESDVDDDDDNFDQSDIVPPSYVSSKVKRTVVKKIKEKIKSIKVSRTARSKVSNTSANRRPRKPMDPIQARILSAKCNRIKLNVNSAGELKVKNEQLEAELRSLKIQVGRQDKALKTFEDTQSALPQVLQRYEDEKRILRERLRKTKDSERKLERDAKKTEISRQKHIAELKRMKQIIGEKNLKERWDLTQKLTDLEDKCSTFERQLGEEKRRTLLQTNALERQLKKEIFKRQKMENDLSSAKNEIKDYSVRIAEKERQLGVANIYTHRIPSTKPTPRTNNLPILAPPTRTKSTLSEPLLAVRERLESDSVGSQLSITYNGATENGRRKNGKKSKKAKKCPSPTPNLQGSNHIENGQNEVHASAFLTAEPSLDETHISTAAMPQDPTKRSRTKSDEKIDLNFAKNKQFEEKPQQNNTGSLLDEMLGIRPKNDSKIETRSDSPTLLDLSAKMRENSSQNVTLGLDEEKIGSDVSKRDAILSELRDLHATSVVPPSTNNNENINLSKNSKQTKKTNPKMNKFNIFDQKIEIDPKEAPSARRVIDSTDIKTSNAKMTGDLDDILGISKSKNISKPSLTSINSESSTKSYAFPGAVESLHDGRASNGRDYRNATKENLIDNLFGAEPAGKCGVPSNLVIGQIGDGIQLEPTPKRSITFLIES